MSVVKLFKDLDEINKNIKETNPEVFEINIKKFSKTNNMIHFILDTLEIRALLQVKEYKYKNAHDDYIKYKKEEHEVNKLLRKEKRMKNKNLKLIKELTSISKAHKKRTNWYKDYSEQLFNEIEELKILFFRITEIKI